MGTLEVAQPRAHLSGKWIKWFNFGVFQLHMAHLAHSCYLVHSDLYVLSIGSHPCLHILFGKRGSGCTKSRFSWFGLLSDPKNYQKWGFPTKSTLGAPTTSLSKQYMKTWMAPYA